MKKLKIGVFMGGRSSEREVSFNSGRTICDHLDTQRFEIVPIFQSQNGLLYLLPWSFLYRGKIKDFSDRLAYEAKQITWDELKILVDFMYLAVHGRYAEDGTLQGILEILGIPYLGSKVFSSALTMDKIIQRDFLKLHNIAIPKAIIVTHEEILNFNFFENVINKRIEIEGLNFPLVVKPHKEGSSIGITIIFNKNELKNALLKAASVHEGKIQSILIEEKIEGMEFTSIIIIDKETRKPFALPITEIITEDGKHFFDYEQKYMPGRATKITPARCDAEQLAKINEVCIKVMDILEIKTIARIDGFLTNDNKVIIIDPNTLSGMSPSSFLFRQAAEIGWSHTKLINHLIEEDLKYYNFDINLKFNETHKIMNKQKIKVAVLMGGNSNEKEISLESGRNVVYKLSPEKYQPIPVFVTSNMEFYAISQQLMVRSSTKEIELGLEKSMKLDWSDLPKIADFVFIALHGGYGENGCMQGAIEMLNLPYNGSGVFASALCMDKFKTNQFLKFKGFDVPKNLLISKKQWQENKENVIKEITSEFSFPIILKPHDDGCSVMVQKIDSPENLQKSIESLFNNNKEYAFFEEYINGMELTVGVLGNNHPIALIPSQTVAAKGILSIEEKFLPGEGENQTPAPISKEIENFVRKKIVDAYKIIGCKGYARVDCFYQNKMQSPTGNDRIVFIEFNTLPGMTPATCIFHQAAEMNIKPMDFIDLIITLGFEEHQIVNPIFDETNNFNKIMSNLNHFANS